MSDDDEDKSKSGKAVTSFFGVMAKSPALVAKSIKLTSKSKSSSKKGDTPKARRATHAPRVSTQETIKVPDPPNLAVADEELDKNIAKLITKRKWEVRCRVLARALVA